MFQYVNPEAILKQMQSADSELIIHVKLMRPDMCTGVMCKNVRMIAVNVEGQWEVALSGGKNVVVLVNEQMTRYPNFTLLFNC
ncbi:hypothetical protein T4B_8786 [Trichinella pseudospiralis]|uniref:Uncharacterized protein n=1 Tax=Trichinella pseudospiralis TaxID=6337 RepID=A0A0V1ISS4_TRIPS|nr:hypothetical protein T4A_3993 [Trichinella pseudospiralis]KRZ09799.1 hypothetical protein T4B_8786 [Trichinella pseudospiralis]KRZ25819.1 hypothetical protein T4C_6653 [Trichinella pseudospiralis]